MINKHVFSTRSIVAALAGMCIFGCAAVTSAASSTWEGDVDGSFLNPDNWTDGVPGFATTANNSTSTSAATLDIATFYVGTPSFFEAAFDSGGHRRLAGLVFSGPSDIAITGLSQSRQLNLRGGAIPVEIQVDGGHVTLASSEAVTSGNGEVFLQGAVNHVWQVAAGASLTVDARISHTAGASFEKTGAGMVVFGGAGSNASSAPQLVSEGVLRYANPLASRGNSNANVTIADGATLELYQGGSYQNFQDQGFGLTMTNGNNGTLMLSGGGVGGMGALRVLGSDNLLVAGANIGESRGKIVLPTNASIGVDAGQTFRLMHGLDGSSAGALSKVGAGTLVFDANHSLPDFGYNQNINVAEGTLLVNTQASDLSVEGTIDASLPSIVFVDSTAGLSVGQLVTGPGIAPGTYIQSLLGKNNNQVIPDKPRVVLSQDAGAGVGVALEFAGVNSALSTSAVVVQSGATLGGTGSIEGSSVIVNAGGTIAPGASIGTFSVGSVDIEGTLAIEFGGSSIDKLVVAGALDVSGASLNLTSLGTLSGDVHVFAEYGSLSGNPFAAVIGLPSGYTLEYNYLGNQQMALVAAPTSGDFDGDGDVDGADFVVWQTNFPKLSEATKGHGDADADGDVDGADFAVWQSNFAAPGPGASPVPEPAAWMLATLAGLFPFFRLGAIRLRTARRVCP